MFASTTTHLHGFQKHPLSEYKTTPCTSITIGIDVLNFPKSFLAHKSLTLHVSTRGTTALNSREYLSGCN